MFNAPTTVICAMILRLVAATGLALLSVSTPAFAADEMPDFSGKLPAHVGEWKKPAKPERYDRKTLYDYIDGGANDDLEAKPGGVAFAHDASVEDDGV